MNKSNLKEHVLDLSTQIDSLKDVNYMLGESKDSLLLNVSLLASANDMNEIEISRLSNLVVINNQEIERLQSECDIEMANLNETILGYQSSFVSSQDSILNFQDSIVQLQYSLSNFQSTTNTSNDFLNNYFFDQIPLPNNSFSLVLSKIVIGNKQESNNNAYSEEGKMKKSVLHLPETLDGTAFGYWSAKPNVRVTSSSKFNDLLNLENKDYFDSKLPQIEILKNKLITIIYHDDTEESFLFNAKESDPNNQRKTLQIDLANEGVENNTSKDIVWRIFAIENECYLSLTYGQLNRLKLDLYPGIQTVFVKYPDEILYFDGSLNYRLQSDKWVTTGNGIYISRNKDSYMNTNTSEYINPENLIFLLKLKEL